MLLATVAFFAGPDDACRLAYGEKGATEAAPQKTG